MRPRVFAPLVLVGSLTAALGAPALETLDEIEECMRGNLPAKASVQTLTLRSVDRTGEETDSTAIIHWKKFDDGYSRVLMRITDPPLRRGSALLAIQSEDRVEMFMYLPELRRVRRVSKHSLQGAVFGTDLTYEDFERFQGLLEEAETKRLPDETIDGRPVYVIEARPASDEESEYERVVSYVDHARCVPLRIELFERSNQLRKTVTLPLDHMTEEPSGWVPRLVRVADLVDETHTLLIVQEIDTAAELPDRLFSVRQLEREGH
jgi:hypothetical protein